MTISILLVILVGMAISLVVLSWFIISESAGYKGPSKVISEKYKRSFNQHPEMRGVQEIDDLLIFDPSDHSSNSI